MFLKYLYSIFFSLILVLSVNSQNITNIDLGRIITNGVRFSPLFKEIGGGGGGGGGITFQSVTTNTSSSFSDPQTFTHNIPSTMNNGYIIVAHGGWRSGGGIGSVVGITFDGASMTMLTGYTNGGSGHDCVIYGLPVASKASGDYTVSVNFIGAGYEGSIACIGLQEVIQSSSSRAGTGQEFNDGLGTLTVVSEISDLVFVVASADDMSTATFESTQTFTSRGINSGAAADGIVSRKAGNSTSTLMYVTNSSQSSVFAGVAIKPF